MIAIGINCRAGTFLVGAQRYANILYNMYTDPLGHQSCSAVHGIGSTSVDSDYSFWPKPTQVDVAFANAERWTEFQSAGKYILAHNLPIGVIDMRCGLYLQYETILRDFSEYAFGFGYRVAYVYYSTLAFDTGFEETRLAYFIYKKDKNFNLSAPTLKTMLRSCYDFFGQSIYSDVKYILREEERYDKNCCYELTYDEKLCISRVFHGGTLKGRLTQRGFAAFPGSCRDYLEDVKADDNYLDFRRPNWGMKLSFSDYLKFQHLHPEYHRLLTVGEMMSVTDWSRVPVGKYPIEQMSAGTPAIIGEWLALQVVHYLNDKWGKKDYEIEYDPKQQKFTGGNANPMRPRKTIDLSKFFNRVFDREHKFPSKPDKYKGKEFIKF